MHSFLDRRRRRERESAAGATGASYYFDGKFESREKSGVVLRSTTGIWSSIAQAYVLSSSSRSDHTFLLQSLCSRKCCKNSFEDRKTLGPPLRTLHCPNHTGRSGFTGEWSALIGCRRGFAPECRCSICCSSCSSCGITLLMAKKTTNTVCLLLYVVEPPDPRPRAKNTDTGNHENAHNCDM